MKVFRFRGGVHPESHKTPSATKAIEDLPLPERLYVPLQQHIGAPAKPEVAIGQRVYKGQLLAHSQGMISAPVHAPSSGTIVDIGEFTAPHPSGLWVRTITLETDGKNRCGKNRWHESAKPTDPFKMAQQEVAARIGAAGIVGMGGATFPAAVKLALGKERRIHTLIINGGECEPYLTCDDRLMRERAHQAVDGIRIMLHVLQADQALIAIEDNKPAAIASMRAARRRHANLHVVVVPSRYPMGSEKQMIQSVTGIEVPAGQRSADIGVIVHNVGTVYAVHRAIRLGRPLLSRVVTVGGGAVREPKNLEVPLGTLVEDLLEFCGGYSEPPARLLMGGPMMGQVLPHSRVPIVKGSNGVIALSTAEIRSRPAMPCIRCGRCVAACPCGLMPVEMAPRIRNGDLDSAMEYGLGDCISCGSCSYVCPSNIPLVQYFNYGKGMLADRREAQRKTEATRRLAQERRNRLEREARARAKAAAQRKAEKATDEAREKNSPEVSV